MGVAVDGAGTVYVADGDSRRVVKLAAGSSTQTELPFTGLGYTSGVAVDSTGAVYVTDYYGNEFSRAIKLAAGSRIQTVLPFTGLDSSLWGVAVDAAGNVYVAVNNRVVKLSAG
jgi:serine/threonine-protein kinase